MEEDGPLFGVQPFIKGFLSGSFAAFAFFLHYGPLAQTIFFLAMLAIAFDVFFAFGRSMHVMSFFAAFCLGFFVGVLLLFAQHGAYYVLGVSIATTALYVWEMVRAEGPRKI